jgi:hypothetical protein
VSKVLRRAARLSHVVVLQSQILKSIQQLNTLFSHEIKKGRVRKYDKNLSISFV